MILRKRIKLFMVMAMINISVAATAQDNTKLFFTTGIGLIKTPGKLSNVFHPSIAFNSGIEIMNSKKWFAQGTLDFNTLRYSQQVKEDRSPYLFQNTGSSLFMVALNGGKNFYFGHNKWLASLYAGSGYLNIGEPRLVQESPNTIKQQVSRNGNIFGKAGGRIGYKTRIKFLQTIYFDGSWWKSPAVVQGHKLNGISLFLGTRMSM
jgi:hypothetical protein